MRIDGIELVRFGHFINRKIEFPLATPDYYVIYGDNEAGKSTLLRGISGLLFGIPARTPDTHSCKSSELRLAAIISDAGKTFSFQRRKGTSGTLLDVNGYQIEEDKLTRFLRELDRERFEQFFGLTHQRLREGGEELLLGKGDVGSALFQASGLLELRSLLEGLDGEAKDLFSAKSRTKVINRAIEDYKQARSDARRTAISAGTVKQKQAELDAAEETLKKLKTESQSLQQELVRLRRISGNKPDVARLQELRGALVAVKGLPVLPPDVRKQRDDAFAILTEATNQITTTRRHIAERTARIEALPVCGLFKLHAKEIEELNSGTSDYTRGVTDRPKRASERDEATRLAESEWKEVWQGRSISEAEALRGPYSQKAEILGLITEHARLTTVLEEAQEQLRVGQEEQQRLQEELGLYTAPPDPAALRAALEGAKSLGDTDHAMAKLKSEISRLTAGIARDLKSLHPSLGNVGDLEAVIAPLLTTIDRYTHEWELIATRRRDLESRLSEVTDRVQGKQIELDSLPADIGAAGEHDLSQARRKRDRVWQLIRSSAIDQTISAADAQKKLDSAVPLPDVFEECLHRTDDISDLRFVNAKSVAIHDRVVKEISAAREEQQAIEKKLSALSEEELAIKQGWEAEWDLDRSSLLSPAEMKEWMQSRQLIIDRTEQCREKESDLQFLRERAETAATDLSTRLKAIGSETDYAGQPLQIVIKVGEGVAKTLEDRIRLLEDLRQRLHRLAIEKRRARLAACETQLADWSKRWIPHVRALLLLDNETPENVARALEVLEKVFEHLKDAERLEYRLKRIGENIGQFERRTSQLVNAIDASLGSLPASAAITQLHTRLLEVNKAETQRDELEAENRKDEELVSSLASRSQTAADTLTKLRLLANCSDDAQLETIITATERRTEKQEEYDRIAVGLIERNSTSDVTQIEEEASMHDVDSLNSEILSSEERLKNLQDEVFKIGSDYGRLVQEFESLQNSDQSTIYAQATEDCAARIRPAVAQYLRLRLASEVLQRAIESYREKHQGPVLSRASEFFSSLTLGDHLGLTTGFGDDDKPVLVAVRKNKEQVHVEGLSDGTRDQLYLALRLAAIEHHVQVVSPCPVILDDILINSDDERASAAMRIFGELGKRTQVLFFTHHRRLAELGVKAGGQAIELESVALESAI